MFEVFRCLKAAKTAKTPLGIIANLALTPSVIQCLSKVKTTLCIKNRAEERTNKQRNKQKTHFANTNYKVNAIFIQNIRYTISQAKSDCTDSPSPEVPHPQHKAKCSAHYTPRIMCRRPAFLWLSVPQLAFLKQRVPEPCSGIPARHSVPDILCSSPAVLATFLPSAAAFIDVLHNWIQYHPSRNILESHLSGVAP